MKVHYVGCDMINLYILTKLFITYRLVVCPINDKKASSSITISKKISLKIEFLK